MRDLSLFREELKTEAAHLGFNQIGIAPALPVPHYPEYLDWVEAGYHGRMGYLSREDTLAKRGDPRLILDGCQRIICLALPYYTPQATLGEVPPGKGRVSAYAINRDYHQILWEKLVQLEEFIQSRVGENINMKSYVDTGPILERSYASLAGIGIAGKNSCLLIQGAGSYFFLAEILTDLQLPVDMPFTRDLCGTCRRCIDACPTGCILPNRTIDASRCISYLTIENKAATPDNLKGQIGAWVFGCDVCQVVCPHNARTRKQTTTLGAPLLPELLDLIELFSYDEDTFINKFSQSPLSRARLPGMLRNAAIILGNQKFDKALPVLEKTLAREHDPAVQDACRWAIREIETAT